MIIRVARAAEKAKADSLLVATDSELIAELCVRHGFDALMTQEDHPSGTDRLNEVAQIKGWDDDDVVINVQGDEPLIPAAVIEQVAQLLIRKPECDLATLCEPIEHMKDLLNPSVVKVARSFSDEALYFSRAPIPAGRTQLLDPSADPAPWLHEARRHLGLYAYRVRALRAFASWGEGRLEALEALEQLRFMEHSKRIAIEQSCEQVPGGVDTQEDLDRMNRLPEQLFA